MPSLTVPPRNQQLKEHTWNAESVFASPSAWEAELKSILEAISALAQYQNRLGESPAVLADALETRDRLMERLSVVVMYAMTTYEVDKTDPAAGSMPGRAQAVQGRVLAAQAYIEPELLAIGMKSVQEWMKAEPRLQLYRHYFDNLFRRQAHVRSQEAEELLGMLVDPFSGPSHTAGMLTDADFKFKDAVDSQGNRVPVSQGNYQKILSSADRTARRTAWESFTDQHLAFQHTLASNLVYSMKQNVFLMRARKHSSTLEASLFENNIPTTVFHNLIETFRKHLPTWQRYFTIRKQALNLDALQYYDLWAPLSDHYPQIPFEQAVEWICQGLSPMGETYVQTLRRGCLEERWVDRYANTGKTSGAFSYGARGTHPFIVMNYSDDVFSLSTLAHELGHSMHSYLTWKNQPQVYSDYSLFVAEVASNFHQAMVRGYLLQEHQDALFQLALLEEAMANFLRYFFIMPTLARFELETHQRLERGETLGANEMVNLLADLFEEGFGGALQTERPRLGIIWATFGHLFSDYYVYQYATGISAANALSQRILNRVPGAVGQYLEFLKAGSSLYPLDALRLAGVDLTSPQPVEQAFTVLADYVNRLESLLNQSRQSPVKP